MAKRDLEFKELSYEGVKEVDLGEFVSTKKTYCLNAKVPRSCEDLFLIKEKGVITESDVDEQLLLGVIFTGVIRISTVKLTSNGDGNIALKLN